MQTTQTRSHKTSSTPKITDRSVTVEVDSKQGDAELRTGSAAAIDAQERQMLSARAAYFRAERRGIVPGGELQDWVEAEAEVLRLTGGG